MRHPVHNGVEFDDASTIKMPTQQLLGALALRVRRAASLVK